MLDISREFSRPVDHFIKKMSRNDSGVRSSSFCIWQAKLFEANQFIIIIIIIRKLPLLYCIHTFLLTSALMSWKDCTA